MTQMTFLDFFSGIGGFRKGFELCGMRCVGHCEIDKYADRSYRAIHNIKEDEWYAADITKVTPAELPRADLWAAGFPCQDISVSGRQRGINGARSGLFFTLAELVKGQSPENRPTWIVLENVPYALQRIRNVMNRNQLCVVPPKSSETEQKSSVSLHIIFGFSQARTATQSTPYPVPNEMPLEDQDELSLSPKQLAWPRYLLWRRPQW